MAKQTVNLGTSANKGDGDPLRTAFDKVNDNFDELYARDINTDFSASVFGDDSTLLVDAVNNKIVGPVETASVDAVSLRTSATSIALGSNAGKTNQANLAVAIGTNAGETGQSLWTVAVGTSAGSINQGMQSVAVGNNAGLNEQGQDATAIGQSAGAEYQGHDTVAVGAAAGAFGQEQGAVAVGYSAAPGNLLAPSYVSGGTGGAALVVDDTTGIYPGFRVRGTGFTTQTVVSVDSGTTLTLSANASQTPTSDMFFLGGQGTDAIAIGKDAAAIQQSTSAIAIGKDAGKTTQGANAIAIGEKAGYSNQAANSIVINATGAEVYNFGANSTIITPIRNDTMTTILGYDADTGQVTHNAAIPGYTNTADLKVLVAASADFADFQTRIAAL